MGENARRWRMVVIKMVIWILLVVAAILTPPVNARISWFVDQTLLALILTSGLVFAWSFWHTLGATTKFWVWFYTGNGDGTFKKMETLTELLERNMITQEIFERCKLEILSETQAESENGERNKL